MYHVFLLPSTSSKLVDKQYTLFSFTLSRSNWLTTRWKCCKLWPNIREKTHHSPLFIQYLFRSRYTENENQILTSTSIFGSNRSPYNHNQTKTPCNMNRKRFTHNTEKALDILILFSLSKKYKATVGGDDGGTQWWWSWDYRSVCYCCHCYYIVFW